MKAHRRSTLLIQSLGLTLGTALAIGGCAGAGNGGGGGGGVATPDLQAKKVANEADALSWLSGGDYRQVALNSDFPNGSKGQVYAGEYNMTGSKNGIAATVVMRAAYTATDLYMQIEWQDATATNDMNRRRFLFNGPNETGGTVAGWSSQLNDDKFAIAFDINGAADGSGTFATKGCTVGCHGSMNPEMGSMDVWHWKASRSNPMGYVNDQWADPAGRKNDGGDPIEVRNWKVSNDIASGPGNMWDSTSGNQVVTLPNQAEGTTILDPNLFLLKTKGTPVLGNAVAGETLLNAKCMGCHSPIGNWKSKFAARGMNQTDLQMKTYMAGGTHPGAGSTAGMSQADWDNLAARMRGFTGVPGYVLQPPTGSNADLVVLNSKTVYNNGKYVVRLRRKLITNNVDDVQFDVNAQKDYVFGVAVMDKDGKNHAGSAVQHIKFQP